MRHCPDPDCVHLAETGRSGEFRDDIQRCSDCGTPLADGPPPEAGPRKPQWIQVEVPPDPHAQRLALAAFESAGIPCVTQQAGKAGRMLAPGAPAVELFVPEPLAERAALVLERTLHAPVELPDGDDLEFVDEDDEPIPAQEVWPDRDDADAGDDTGAGWRPADAPATACPRCGADGITLAPPAPGESRGLLSRLLRRRHERQCLACGHQW